MSQMPDKIWLHKDTKYNTGDIVCGYQYEFAQEIECEGIENFVEYIRKDIVDNMLATAEDHAYFAGSENTRENPTDAFIEKACWWLKDNYPYYFETDIKEEFVKAMKEE